MAVGEGGETMFGGIGGIVGSVCLFRRILKKLKDCKKRRKGQERIGRSINHPQSRRREGGGEEGG